MSTFLLLLLLPQRYVFSSKSQQCLEVKRDSSGCCCYHKGTYFQANHNGFLYLSLHLYVVVATTKVRIFKQITTRQRMSLFCWQLLLLPQRYVFSSKSQLSNQRLIGLSSCCCYHKGTYFQANHNTLSTLLFFFVLLLLPQRYVFSSKSQHVVIFHLFVFSCCCYHKGTYFQANHN